MRRRTFLSTPIVLAACRRDTQAGHSLERTAVQGLAARTIVGVLGSLSSAAAFEPSGITSASGSGADAGNKEILTSWRDSLGSAHMTGISGTPVHRTAESGPPVLAADGRQVIAFGQPHVQLANATIYTDKSEIASMPGGSTCRPFGYIFVGSHGPANGSATGRRCVLAWGSTRGGARTGPFICLWKRGGVWEHRVNFTDNTNLDLGVCASSSQDFALIMMCGGHGGRYRVDRMKMDGAWVTAQDKASVAIQSTRGTKDLTGINRVSIGGRYDGAMRASNTARIMKASGFYPFTPPTNSADWDALFKRLRMLVKARFGNNIQHWVTRHAIITASTKGWSAPKTSDKNNIAGPCMWKDGSTFRLAVGGHDDVVITQASCSGNPLTPTGWSVDSGGTGISNRSLSTAGHYDAPVAPPDHCAFLDYDGGTGALVHGEASKASPPPRGAHSTWAITVASPNLTGGEGNAWRWANSAAPVTRPNTSTYLRRFQYDAGSGSRWFAVGNAAMLYVGQLVAKDAAGVGTYTRITNYEAFRAMVGDCRHCAPLVVKSALIIAYTQDQTQYEHICLAAVNMAASSNAENWVAVHPVTGQSSGRYDWILPNQSIQWNFSTGGGVGNGKTNSCQDPFWYVDGSTTYLLWTEPREQQVMIADVSKELAARIAALPFAT